MRCGFCGEEMLLAVRGEPWCDWCKVNYYEDGVIASTRGVPDHPWSHPPVGTLVVVSNLSWEER